MLFGFLFSSQDHTLEPASAKHAPYAFCIGLCSLFGYLTLFAISSDYYSWPHVVLSVTSGWCLTLGILYYGRVLLSFRHETLRYLSHLAMPFYVMHQPVLVAAGYYVIGWQNISAGWKFAVICAGSTIMLVALYEVIVRNTVVLAFLLGAKPLSVLTVLQRRRKRKEKKKKRAGRRREEGEGAQRRGRVRNGDDREAEEESRQSRAEKEETDHRVNREEETEEVEEERNHDDDKRTLLEVRVCDAIRDNSSADAVSGIA